MKQYLTVGQTCAHINKMRYDLKIAGNYRHFIFVFYLFFLFGPIAPVIAACVPGCYDTGAECQPCPTGTYSATDTESCSVCATGQTGNTLTGATKCVNYKTLKITGGTSAFIRAEQTTHPSLGIKDDQGNVYYGNLSDVLPGKLKVKYNDTVFSLAETGKDPATCGTPAPKFEIKLTGINENDTFSFSISALGNFTIDWGDGQVDKINRANTTNTTYSHTYNVAGNYSIKLKGLAVGYNTTATVAAVSFVNSANSFKTRASYSRPRLTLPNNEKPRKSA